MLANTKVQNNQKHLKMTVLHISFLLTPITSRERKIIRQMARARMLIITINLVFDTI